MYSSILPTLSALGLTHHAPAALLRSLHLHSVRTAHSILCLRRVLERSRDTFPPRRSFDPP
jgi:hypothetical protein